MIVPGLSVARLAVPGLAVACLAASLVAVLLPGGAVGERVAEGGVRGVGDAHDDALLAGFPVYGAALAVFIYLLSVHCNSKKT